MVLAAAAAAVERAGAAELLPSGNSPWQVGASHRCSLPVVPSSGRAEVAEVAQVAQVHVWWLQAPASLVRRVSLV